MTQTETKVPNIRLERDSLPRRAVEDCGSNSAFMKNTDTVLLGCLFLLTSCAEAERIAGQSVWRKVEIDLAQLDARGLRGPADGKVSVSYEFCIPDTPECRTRVKSIDRTVQFMPGSRGRIGAREKECLCIGSTYQEDYKKVLQALAELPYVERIIECHFE